MIRIPTEADFLALRPAPQENHLSNEAIAHILADSTSDLSDEFSAVDALCACGIRPSQVDDLAAAITIARRMRAKQETSDA